MPLITWSAPQVRLGGAYSAVGFTINVPKGQEQAEMVSGQLWICFKDDQCWSSNWHAALVGDNWNVTCDGRTFTGLQSINVAANSYLADRILEWRSGRVVVEASTYDGQLADYSGPCICHELGRNHFLWLEATGGDYPEDCFRCSCGRRLWRLSFGPWLDVNDDKTWQMFITHNGKAVRPIAIEGKEVCIANLS